MKAWITENRRTSLALVILLVLSTLVRVWFITHIPTIQQYDFETYYQLAVNVATGQGYTLAWDDRCDGAKSAQYRDV
jgi:lantibiotic modifying enzyme